MTLSAQALTKRYGDPPEYEAVRGANLDIGPGEFVSIVGRSGSGKSTLLAMLGALTPPSEGQVLLDGTDLWEMTETERARFRGRHIGFVFQFPSLLPNLTALDNVAVPALLGRTMDAETAYVRAHELLTRVGLGHRAGAYPSGMSGGEQRRVVIARALINQPRLLLADEPTSDLDTDSETDIIDLIEGLQRSDGFGFLLVTHSLDLANRAGRRYEMREGRLLAARATEPRPAAQPHPRHFGPAEIGVRPAPPAGRGRVALGADLMRGAALFLLGSAAVFAGIVLVDFGVGKYQQMQFRARGERLARLSNLALSSLEGNIEKVSDLGEGRYELAVDLRNATGEGPIYVMAPDMHAYVQIAKEWQELPIAPAADDGTGVVGIDSDHVYRYRFDARVKSFAQLLPGYMHVRFSESMLVSPQREPKDDVFERRDNYYVYLKPYDADDVMILQRTKFAGRPPVWIPMPPH
jgi:putative ABC transport system ATP-binding protein/macrolide transport system ATP-binding/permease protein/lipoprotein-releasing system ATP-binding protein